MRWHTGMMWQWGRGDEALTERSDVAKGSTLGRGARLPLLGVRDSSAGALKGSCRGAVRRLLMEESREGGWPEIRGSQEDGRKAAGSEAELRRSEENRRSGAEFCRILQEAENCSSLLEVVRPPRGGRNLRGMVGSGPKVLREAWDGPTAAGSQQEAGCNNGGPAALGRGGWLGGGRRDLREGRGGLMLSSFAARLRPKLEGRCWVGGGERRRRGGGGRRKQKLAGLLPRKGTYLIFFLKFFNR